jgi:stage IV sporulation protein FB
MGGFHLFTLADIPVRVSPWYALLVLFFVNGMSAGNPLLVALVITVSLLAHELGHALVARHYKLSPHILLHGFGGVTGHERARTPRQDALIVAAGPVAGLVLSALAFAALKSDAVRAPQAAELLGLTFGLNLFWSLFNLLPMWPLDGGQLLRLGASKLWKPARGERITHIVSIVVVAVVAFASHMMGMSHFTLIILAITAYQNVQALSEGARTPLPRDNPFARELLRNAEAAYNAGDDVATARLCHQLRNEAHVEPEILARAWSLLGITATRREDYEEALSYLRRAPPDTSEVVEATAQCFYQLGMYDALETLCGTRAFAKLPSETRDAILAALRDGPQNGPG